MGVDGGIIAKDPVVNLPSATRRDVAKKIPDFYREVKREMPEFCTGVDKVSSMLADSLSKAKKENEDLKKSEAIENFELLRETSNLHLGPVEVWEGGDSASIHTTDCAHSPGNRIGGMNRFGGMNLRGEFENVESALQTIEAKGWSTKGATPYCGHCLKDYIA